MHLRPTAHNLFWSTPKNAKVDTQSNAVHCSWNAATCLKLMKSCGQVYIHMKDSGTCSQDAAVVVFDITLLVTESLIYGTVYVLPLVFHQRQLSNTRYAMFTFLHILAWNSQFHFKCFYTFISLVFYAQMSVFFGPICPAHAMYFIDITSVS